LKKYNYLKIVLALLSSVCLLDLPYWYFQIFRITAFTLFLLFAYNEQKFDFWVVTWMFFAIIVQPFYKISFGRELWKFIDIFFSIILIYSFFINFKKK